MGWWWALAAVLLPVEGRFFLAQTPGTGTAAAPVSGALGASLVAVGNATNATNYTSGPCAAAFCAQACTPKGSDEFVCSCRDGYTLAEDGVACHDVDECAANNGGCVQECVNLPGSHVCACSSGYSFNDTCAEPTCAYTGCADVDECSNRTDGCAHTCANTQGSYICGCSQGYFLEPNRHNCSDINECPSIGCDHYCENLEGSFQCHCHEGYAMVNGSSCVDLNECAYENAGCAHECINTPGSFMCACKPGYYQLFSNCLEPMEYASMLSRGRGTLRKPRAAGSPSPLLQRLRSISRAARAR